MSLIHVPQFPVPPVVGSPAISLESCLIISLQYMLTTKVSQGYTMLIFGSHMPSAKKEHPTITSRVYNAATQHYSTLFSTGWPHFQHITEHPSKCCQMTCTHTCAVAKYLSVFRKNPSIHSDVELEAWKHTSTFSWISSTKNTTQGEEPAQNGLQPGQLPQSS